MKITPTKERAMLREEYINILYKFLEEMDEDIQRTKSNEIAFPVVGVNDNEYYIKIVVSVPTGSRDGDGYDPYALAEEYQMKLLEKEAKRQKKANEKKKKD